MKHDSKQDRENNIFLRIMPHQLKNMFKRGSRPANDNTLQAVSFSTAVVVCLLPPSYAYAVAVRNVDGGKCVHNFCAQGTCRIYFCALCRVCSCCGVHAARHITHLLTLFNTSTFLRDVCAVGVSVRSTTRALL